MPGESNNMLCKHTVETGVHVDAGPECREEERAILTLKITKVFVFPVLSDEAYTCRTSRHS